MEQLKALWKKQWFKNLIFFSFLGIAFFTELPRWIQVQYTALGLEGRGNMAVVNEPFAVLNYDLKVEDVNGKETAWKTWKGEPVLVNFWASWCIPCLAEFRTLEALQKAVPDLQLKVINLEDRASFKRYVSGTSHALPFYRQTSPLPPGINPTALPATFLIDGEGVLQLKRNGAADWTDPITQEQLRSFLTNP